MRYFLHIAYDGTNYRGWQWQPNVNSVQGILEKALENIFKKTIRIHGCGRTDAGVHASQYFCHFNVASPLSFDLKFRLNKHLPADVVAHEVILMKQNQHARYDVTARKYDYFIHSHNDPFLNKYSTRCDLENINFEAMKEACVMLQNNKDFRPLCKQPEIHNHTFCEIYHVALYVHPSKNRMHLSIRANRFLRGMIRIIISYLLKIGREEINLDDFQKILRQSLNPPEHKPAAPNGLYLSEVVYPYLKTKHTAGAPDFLQFE